MSDKPVGSIHWSFWMIGAVTLVFNGMGVINFFVQMNPESLATFPETYRPIIEGRPAWATAAFAAAVFGGSLGCLLLLLRKSAASYGFVASLLGVIATMAHIVGVVRFTSFEAWVGVLMQLVVTVFLIWYSKLAANKGWVSVKPTANAT